ncbi:aldehyde dehydrogenase family protein, partial [Priestia megaterium]|uniref:aldehyde dehydrogenase family protein n=1 Tax=Priestia megaterium TaxID=1404 RepID=UPI002FFF2B86
MVVSYSHEPFTNFKDENNKQVFQEALTYVNTQLGKTYPLVINGEKVDTEEKITSVNPANIKEVIGYVSTVNKDLAEQAIQSALKAFETWKKWKVEHRADILFRAA